LARPPRRRRPQAHDADKLFDEAFAWRQQWPSLTQSIANVSMTSENSSARSRSTNKTLELEPKAVDALIGRVRALTFLGKAEDAIATTDRLIAIGWYVGDARTGAPFNENELETLRRGVGRRRGGPPSCRSTPRSRSSRA